MLDGTTQVNQHTGGIIGLATGAHVLTDGGECRVEQLTVGDQLIDVDGRSVPLLATEAVACRATGDSAPVRIALGALGNHRELVVAPDQLVSWNGAMIAARAIVDGVVADVAYTGMVAYHRLLTARDAVIVVERAAIACMAQPLGGIVGLQRDAAASAFTPA